MACLPIGQNHHAGPQLAQNAGDLDAIFERVLNRAVGQVERLPPGNTQNARSVSGFAGAVLCAAARAGLALGQVENGRAQAAGGHTQQGSSARLFHIVAMGSDGEHVDGRRIGECIGAHGRLLKHN